MKSQNHLIKTVAFAILNTGLMINGQVMTLKSNAVYKGKQTLLKDIVQKRYR